MYSRSQKQPLDSRSKQQRTTVYQRRDRGSEGGAQYTDEHYAYNDQSENDYYREHPSVDIDMTQDGSTEGEGDETVSYVEEV